MKRIYISLFILLAITMASCKKDFLEEVNQGGITADPFYATAGGMEALINTCYTPLRFWYGKEGGATLTELGTDLFVKGGDNKHPEISSYDPVNFNAQNPLLRVYWERLYAAINDCNTAINRLDASPLAGDVKKSRMGEVRFLRAMYNWIIVETWGGVHLTTEESKGVITVANKTSVDKFYELIFADLDIAISNLNNVTPGGGRVTKPAAEAFKARMLLTRGKNAEAAVLAKKVISDYNFKLFDNYASLWNIANSNGNLNSEVIWFVNYTTDNLVNTDIPTYDGNSQANAFRSEGGNQLHMMFTPRYDFHPGMLIDIGNDVGFQRYATTKRLVTLYNENIDQRYEGTFKEVWMQNGGPKGIYPNMVDTAIYWSHNVLPDAYKAARATRFEVRDLNDLYNADQSLKDNRNFIEMHKHNDPSRSGIFEFRSKRDAFVMRISEMYLIVAEASMAGNTAEAVNFMNTLRMKRAKPGKEDLMKITAADLNIDFILEERARELVGEQLRWFDLKRTNKLIEYVQKYNTDAKSNIKAHHLLRPIPQSQLDAVTNKSEFSQNPGYN
jgi:starch-binding outer membrane protein, SusD/RagB family